MLRLKRNEVKLVAHNPERNAIAADAVSMDNLDETLVRMQKTGITQIENRNEPDTSLCALSSEKKSYVQWTNNVPYKLKEPFDFSFLGKYGKVFKVFDDQDSGNICFGVRDREYKYFIKFAGAPTDRANVSAAEAVKRMRNTVPIYQDLTHPLLTGLVTAEEIGGGFATVFDWTDAECMGRQYPQSREKFMQMPLETRLRVFDDILDFHAHVVQQGYVAIDFYDGCIMYDFKRDKTVICDIEFYTKVPYTNSMGRMWGSSRFMSPEEFRLGAVIDEITNVYTMGATAFALFGDKKRRDRRIEDWKLNRELYYTAKKAVCDERSQRPLMSRG